MSTPLPPSRAALRRFLASERGAARTQAFFAIAALIGVAVVSVFFLVTGGTPAPARAPASPEAVALAELTDGRMRQFSRMEVQERLARYLDRAERTDAQLRNAHRIWARRINDPDYGDPDLAADMFAIIDTALRLRGVRPHSDI